jgi:hypothetical protein
MHPSPDTTVSGSDARRQDEQPQDHRALSTTSAVQGLDAAGVLARCPDCNQSMGDHINGCPVYPPMGTPGVTCPAAAAGVEGPDHG